MTCVVYIKRNQTLGTFLLNPVVFQKQEDPDISTTFLTECLCVPLQRREQTLPRERPPLITNWPPS